jgi:hypothetical protein
MTLRTSVAGVCGACLVLGFCPEVSVAATATDLVTICTSATTTIQASKCTAWQYNYYSPTVYIESYPTVTPAETGINDPNYEYRLGSTLTPTMGVKVCPTALTPGVSFNSPSADPCPNNKLVAASTVLPTNTYAVATSPAGIVVYQVNTSGVSEVTGSPFVPSPIPYNPESEQSAPAPMVTALDPTGEYLYAVYNLGGVSGALVYSFNMVSGVPHQLSNAGGFGSCDSCDANPTEIIATAQHVYMQFDTSGAEFPSIQIISTKNGVLSPTPSIFLSGFVNVTPNVAPISFAVDPQERFLYVYTSSTGGAVPDTTAIYSLNFVTSTATLVQVVSQSGQVLLGAQ